jgi:ATP/maltotriose-dependent transcriptional regulator MalT
MERIAFAARHQLVFFVAPAGYGKTLALRAYLDELRLPHIRYEMRADDDTLLGFVRGLTDAFSAYVPAARKTLSLEYEDTLSASSPAAELAAWLHGHLRSFSGVLVIDELHYAASDPNITVFLTSLIERTKDDVKWFLGSRSTFNLPVASWIAYGYMESPLDENDLRFTIEEARAVARAARVHLGDAELREIFDRTEGWPTALTMALRTGSRLDDIGAKGVASREMLYRYLAEQVYGALNAQEREFLHLTASLPKIEIGVLLSAGYERAHALLERLRDRAGFMYFEGEQVYRCHGLFQAFLRRQLELEGEACMRATRLRAAQALEKFGNIPDALSVYVSVPCEANILRVLCEHGVRLIDLGHADVIQSAVDALEMDRRGNDPLASGFRGICEAYDGRLERAQALLSDAVAIPGAPELFAQFACRLAAVRFNQGQDITSLLQPVATDSSLDEGLRANAACFLACNYAARGDVAEAQAAFNKAFEYVRTAQQDEFAALLLHRLGTAAIALRVPFEQVCGLFAEARDIAAKKGASSVSAMAACGLATAFTLYNDDLPGTAWYAQQALSAVEKGGARLALYSALLLHMHVAMRSGDAEKLAGFSRQFTNAAYTDRARDSYANAARAALAAWSGRFEDALRISSSAQDRSFHGAERLLNIATCSIYAVGCGRNAQAVELAEEALIVADAGPFPYFYGEVTAFIARMLCGVTLALTGRSSRAARIARDPACASPGAASAQQFLNTLCGALRNPSLASELPGVLAKMRASDYGGLARTLEHIVATESRLNVSREVQLTQAESDVLHWLSDGLSPKEIACNTNRSVYTIQSHIQNAIRKLGCSGRTEALSVARKKGLLKFN